MKPLTFALRMKRASWYGIKINWSAYALVLPFFVPFSTFTMVAIIFGSYISLSDWGIVGNPTWVGLANYQRAFQDEYVIKAFVNVVKYAAIVVPGVTSLALIFALYVNQNWFFSRFARAAFFSPFVVSSTVVGLVWVWILDTQFGLLNQYLVKLGGNNIPWLTSTRWSLVGVSIATIWWDLGFSFVLFLAALQEIPREIIEAASIDGATGLETFWHITIPTIKPNIRLVITLQIIATLRIFSQVYLMTNGGPSSSSVSVIHYIFTEGVTKFNLGYAAAVSMLLFGLIMLVTIAQQLLIREQA